MSENITLYVALPWPESQDYMGEPWFRDESYFDAVKNTWFIPKERYNEKTEFEKSCSQV